MDIQISLKSMLYISFSSCVSICEQGKHIWKNIKGRPDKENRSTNKEKKKKKKKQKLKGSIFFLLILLGSCVSAGIYSAQRQPQTGLKQELPLNSSSRRGGSSLVCYVTIEKK